MIKNKFKVILFEIIFLSFTSFATLVQAASLEENQAQLSELLDEAKEMGQRAKAWQEKATEHPFIVEQEIAQLYEIKFQQKKIEQQRLLIKERTKELEKSIKNAKELETSLSLANELWFETLRSTIEGQASIDAQSRQIQLAQLRENLTDPSVSPIEQTHLLVKAWHQSIKAGRDNRLKNRGILLPEGLQVVKTFCLGDFEQYALTLDGKKAYRLQRATKNWEPMSERSTIALLQLERVLRKQERGSAVVLPIEGLTTQTRAQ